MAEKTPIAVITGTTKPFNEWPHIYGEDMWRTDEEVEVIGDLVFYIAYCKATSQGLEYLSLFLECQPKGQIKKNGDVSDWGEFVVDAEVGILSTTGEFLGQRLKKESAVSKKCPQQGFQFFFLTHHMKESDTKAMYLTHKRLQVCAKIYSVKPANASEARLLKLLNEPVVPSLWEAYFESGIGADWTLTGMDGKCVKVHSGVLMTASPVFKPMFEEHWKEGESRETTLDDMSSAKSIKTFLKCVYTGSLSHLYGVELTVLKEVINAAEKYQLPALKNGAAVLLPGYVTLANAVQLVHFAKRYGIREAETFIRQFIRSNIYSVVDNTVPMDAD